MRSLAFAQIDHFDGIVAERANEQSFAGSIEPEVIYSPFDSGQRDRLLQFDSSVVGSGDWHTTSGYGDNNGEN
jgi:hypothetical protein